MTAGRVSAYILLGLNGLEFANSIRPFSCQKEAA